jgi:general secretion pathway protein G
MNLRLKSKTGIALIGLGFVALLFLAIERTEYPLPLHAHSREAVLRTDLRMMRDAIDHYTLDKQQPPQSLQDLVDAHYLRIMPVDPITHKADWVQVMGEVEIGPDRKVRGLVDVRSNSDGVDSNRGSYNEW